jgi:hypothetical protein
MVHGSVCIAGQGAESDPQTKIGGRADSSLVMIDVGEQEAPHAPVHDQPNVAADSHRPEILVLRPVQLVETHAGIDQIELQDQTPRS